MQTQVKATMLVNKMFLFFYFSQNLYGKSFLRVDQQSSYLNRKPATDLAGVSLGTALSLFLNCTSLVGYFLYWPVSASCQSCVRGRIEWSQGCSVNIKIDVAAKETADTSSKHSLKWILQEYRFCHLLY